MTDLIQHYSIDLETLDLRPSAVVLTIAIVTDQGHELLLAPNIDEQIRNGRTVDGETFRWWLRQPEASRRAISEAGQRPCGEVRRAVFDMFHPDDHAERYTVWGNAPSFDCDILAHFLGHNRSTIEPDKSIKPWRWYAERDVRTARMAVGRTTPETAHNALDDARAQLADALKFVALAAPEAV